MAGKTVSKSELIERASCARAAGQTVVHCHGCFDIVHPGHVRYLEFARRQGDLLIVSLTGDSQIAKGDQRPYIPQELRAENLAALAAVDLVYINPHPTASALLEELKPDVYVKGREYESSTDPAFAQEREIVTRNGGRVLFSSGDVVFSSTRLIEVLGQNPDLEAERMVMICRRHGIHRESLRDVIARFVDLRVLVVGDVILDRYVLCDAVDLANEAPMMSLTRLEDRTYVGGAGVVARHVAALGAKAYLFSAAARDEAATAVREALERDAVECHLPPSRPRLPEKTRFLVDTTKVMRVEDGQSSPLDCATEAQAVAWAASIPGGVDAVIFCDFGYGTISPRLVGHLRQALAGPPRVVTGDISGPRGNLMQFTNATALCPTERELRSVLHDFEGGLSNVAWNAMHHTRARHMIVTLGRKGLVVFDRQSQDVSDPDWKSRLLGEYLPTLADHVVDPLGAGDALLAATTLAMAAGAGLMPSAYLGAAAAAIEVGRLGNVPVDAGSLRRWLAGRLELSAPPRKAPTALTV
ncbi:MAG: adenylyltransferase/cytidyltransferase family protein [Planctomycetes bacterium]|nr:adenylyltransferase/cytidyltransferase family protein [Planctomycetota bacterium]